MINAGRYLHTKVMNMEKKHNPTPVAVEASLTDGIGVDVVRGNTSSRTTLWSIVCRTCNPDTSTILCPPTSRSRAQEASRVHLDWHMKGRSDV